MAIALDPKKKYKEGIIRCITNRQGNVQIKGYIDRSELYKINGNSFESYIIGSSLKIKNEHEVLTQLIEKDRDFLGLEDPDIFIDRNTGQMHVYFTIPIKYKDKTQKMKIHLGHASGKNLNSLVMTMPILMDNGEESAKEVSIAPLNGQGFRYNLIESRNYRNGTTYSVIKVAIAKEMGKSWSYGPIVFHPADHKIPWIAGHASPGPLLPKSFIDVGKGKLLGIINGREANQIIDGKTNYGIFSVGLFIYDYEYGKIDWVSAESVIQDSEARTITFASQFVETKPGEGILYAHVDDSFVRAYSLKAELIKPFLPKMLLD